MQWPTNALPPGANWTTKGLSNPGGGTLGFEWNQWCIIS